MSPSFRPLLLVALVLALPLRASSAGWDADRILKSRDPDAAAAFLADAAGQARLRAEDADAYRDVFTQAVDLKSVADILNGQGDSPVLRDMLRARSSCEFCHDAAALEAWARTLAPALKDERLAELSAALLDWDTLPEPLRRRLSRQGLEQTAWAALPLSRRESEAAPWLKEQLELYMMELPRTEAEMKDFGDRGDVVDSLLPRRLRAGLEDRAEALWSYFENLEKVRAQAAASPDPNIRAALTRIESAADLDTRLSLLSSLFDGLGLRDDSVKVAAPPRPGQLFDDAARGVTADLLGGGLMSVVAGTWAGDELEAFYRNHHIGFKIAHEDESGTIGWYADGVMNVNEDYITRFLKMKERDIRDLQTDPALLANLTADLAPLFVHEATHQRQEAWRAEHGVPKIWEQNAELEAKQVEALFSVEKSLRDPAFGRMLENDGKTDGPALSALHEAKQLSALGGPVYREKVRAGNYPNLPTLEGGVHERIQRWRFVGRIVDAELTRRAALPPAEAALLEKGSSGLGPFANDEEMALEFCKLSTTVLQAAKTEVTESLEADPAVYAAYREREALVDEQTESRLSGLLTNGPPPRPRHEVPSPAVR
jgi:hypothetical protein